MDNERPVGNEKRPMLKRAKISCFMAAKFKRSKGKWLRSRRYENRHGRTVAWL